MDVNEQRILDLIRQGEGLATGSRPRTQINRDVYETVCAFLNRHGGTPLLGVKTTVRSPVPIKPCRN
jgi:ATP-dependent DNA helicase RecG